MTRDDVKIVSTGQLLRWEKSTRQDLQNRNYYTAEGLAYLIERRAMVIDELETRTTAYRGRYQ